MAVTGRLESAGIPYMVTGSMAANYYAVPRMTRDIDLVVELSASDADRFCALFEDEFYLERRRAVEGRELAIVAPEDLIISKLDSMRESRSEVQLADVRNLLRSVMDLDRLYLEHWTERLGLGALYREVLDA
jgi:hypothetical protein